MSPSAMEVGLKNGHAPRGGGIKPFFRSESAVDRSGGRPSGSDAVCPLGLFPSITSPFPMVSRSSGKWRPPLFSSALPSSGTRRCIGECREHEILFQIYL